MTTKQKLIEKLEELRDSCGDNLGRDGEYLGNYVASALALAKSLPDEGAPPEVKVWGDADGPRAAEYHPGVSPLASRPWMND